MLVAQILKDKGARVLTCTPQETVLAAASILNDERVGALVVMNAERVVGIVSERDIVRAVAEAGQTALDRPVSQIMTADVVLAKPQEHVDELMERMTDRRVRHLPVCDDGRLLGIVSIGDLVKCKIAETLHEAETLKAYIVSG